VGILDRLITPLVPLSFGAPGLRVRAREFQPLESLVGRHAVVTGANSGIGRAAAERLLRLGATVTMVCRDLGRGERARDEIAAATDREATLERCDISDLADVADLATRLRDPIDILIHNAGVLPDHRFETADGIELTWATHIVGPHLLTQLVRPRLSPTSRVVLVSSGGMYLAALGHPGEVPDPYDGVRAYALTKRAQVVLAELWAEVDPLGPRVVAMHPGWADTQAVRSSLPRFHAVTRHLLRDPAGGADTLAWLASVDLAELTHGAFYFDRARRSTHLWPWQRERPELREALWQWCTELTESYR
jgi:dehydrogenase/reductase SDR family member 12